MNAKLDAQDFRRLFYLLNFFKMRKDYLEFKCSNIENDTMFVSIGEKLCFECIEKNERAAITLTRKDIEKLIPFILKYYYNLEPNE